MRIVLRCCSCEQVERKRFKSMLIQVNGNGQFSYVETEYPIVPGTYYGLLLKGYMPEEGNANNIQYVGDMLAAEFGGKLKALSITEEDDARKGADK